MSGPILAIRPQPGCDATVLAGKAFGLEIEPCPLLEVRCLAWSLPPGAFDGLLLGSANAVRCLGSFGDNLVDKPVYAVGETTANAAREAGFTIARTGETNLQSLLDSLAGERLHLLRLAGRERVAVAPPPGITIATATLYETAALQLPASVAERLRAGTLVLLHSGSAARHFGAECERLGVHRGDIRLAALSPRIAEAAGSGWAAVRAAARPNDAALLALARQLCHDPPGG